MVRLTGASKRNDCSRRGVQGRFPNSRKEYDEIFSLSD